MKSLVLFSLVVICVGLSKAADDQVKSGETGAPGAAAGAEGIKEQAEKADGQIDFRQQSLHGYNRPVHGAYGLQGSVPGQGFGGGYRPSYTNQAGHHQHHQGAAHGGYQGAGTALNRPVYNQHQYGGATRIPGVAGLGAAYGPHKMTNAVGPGAYGPSQGLGNSFSGTGGVIANKPPYNAPVQGLANSGYGGYGGQNRLPAPLAGPGSLNGEYGGSSALTGGYGGLNRPANGYGAGYGTGGPGAGLAPAGTNYDNGLSGGGYGLNGGYGSGGYPNEVSAAYGGLNGGGNFAAYGNGGYGAGGLTGGYGGQQQQLPGAYGFGLRIKNPTADSEESDPLGNDNDRDFKFSSR